MRILIVEDEVKTANYLKKGLMASGFVVNTAHNGEDGLFLAEQSAYDLIILDVEMPKKDGFTLLKELRQKNQEVRVIFLTARDAIEDKVRGLELGGDDYLVKPFSFSELLARVRSILRRSHTSKQSIITIADLTIDLNKHKVERSGERIELTSKEFALLKLLVQRKGEVLSRAMIAELVWDINFDSDTNVVDVAIRRLRQKIDDKFAKKLIHTMRGMGYFFEDC